MKALKQGFLNPESSQHLHSIIQFMLILKTLQMLNEAYSFCQNILNKKHQKILLNAIFNSALKSQLR